MKSLWQYQHRLDTGVLRTIAYPYLREIADFWEDYLKFENGRSAIFHNTISRPRLAKPLN